jgi:hypothetical protein
VVWNLSVEGIGISSMADAGLPGLHSDEARVAVPYFSEWECANRLPWVS